MKRFAFVLAVLLTLLSVAPAPRALACPSCNEAIANASKLESEKDNTPAAYNQSIYVMVGVPYLTFAVLGFVVYRGARRNADYLTRAKTEPGKAGE